MAKAEIRHHTPTNPFGTEGSIKKDPEKIGDVPVPKTPSKSKTTDEKEKPTE